MCFDIAQKYIREVINEESLCRKLLLQYIGLQIDVAPYIPICRGSRSGATLRKNNDMGKPKTFILHDESVNTYGFRMLTSGANLEEFRKNPVMLLNHDDWSMPIGRWEDIRKEDGKILADAVFDENDPRAVEVMRKVENGFIRMASIGAWPPEETSDAYDLKQPGQTGPTVTKWTVREASIVTIGANHNALAFYDRTDGKLISLDGAEDAMVRLMDSNHNKNQSKMGKLTEILNLSDNASEQAIADEVRTILADRDRLRGENTTLRDAIDKINNERKEAQSREAVLLADAAIKDGRYNADGRDTLLKLFDTDFEGTKAMLESIPKRVSVQERMKGAASADATELADLSARGWDVLDRANKLVRLKDIAPDVYKAKFKERFGVEPKE